jgi:hypothetical protein
MNPRLATWISIAAVDGPPAEPPARGEAAIASDLQLAELAGPGPTAAASSAGFSVIDHGRRGAEPTLGVDAAGNKIYIQNGLRTSVSLNGGTTWTDVGPLLGSTVTFDPMLHYDAAIDTVYVNQLTVECTIHSWASNPTGPLAWTTNPHACGMPGIDHQKLEGGPTSLPSAAGRSLYLAYSQAGGGAMVAKSLDSGATWLNVVASSSVQRGTVLWPTGPVTADPAGSYVYLAHHSPSGLRVSSSSNEGLSYTTTLVQGGSGMAHSVDPDIAVDDGGNVYVIYYDSSTHQTYYRHSTNHGATWSSAIQVSDGSVTKSTVFATAVAKSDGKLGIAYYGSKDSTAGPDNCTTSCRWYLYYAYLSPADGTPSITRTQITPDSDPIQIGKICTKGTDCASGVRGLLDFIDIRVDGSGYVHIAYTDGCTSSTGCSGPSSTSQSMDSAGRYARQTSGSTL